MSKVRDRIESLEDLDLFTSYIIDPQNEETIVEFVIGKEIVTNKMIVSYDKKIMKEVEERVQDLIQGNIEYVEDIQSDFDLVPKKVLTIQGYKVNLY